MPGGHRVDRGWPRSMGIAMVVAVAAMVYAIPFATSVFRDEQSYGMAIIMVATVSLVLGLRTIARSDRAGRPGWHPLVLILVGLVGSPLGVYLSAAMWNGEIAWFLMHRFIPVPVILVAPLLALAGPVALFWGIAELFGSSD